jgi:uncharacterized protein (DUF934 family)
MSRLLRRHELVADDWVTLVDAAGATPPGDSDPLIVPFAKFRDNRQQWLARGGRLGVLLAPADKVEEIAADLPNLELVALQFTGPGEGRGYTAAKLLRQRYHFTGEIRAVGHVKQDQLYLMARCGIDSFELAPTEKMEEARATLERFKVAYTPGDPIATPLRQRFQRRLH